MPFSTHNVTLQGRVLDGVDPEGQSFWLRCHNGDCFQVTVLPETDLGVITNLDNIKTDRVPEPTATGDGAGLPAKLRRYIRPGALAIVRGIILQQDQARLCTATQIALAGSTPECYAFEATHWWLTQIRLMADQWLDSLFGDHRAYDTENFAALYRTNLNIIGLPTDDSTQECATLSRLIYGLSSAYLLTGADRYLAAARAGVQYQRESFRSLSHDGRYCFWASAKRRQKYGTQTFVTSLSGDDEGAIPLYEQIYALAGLAQYYRITQEWEVLEDIARTITMFQDFYLDAPGKGHGGLGGYFSHLDYVTMTPDAPMLGKNRLRKNWNSIGDHIPAYLVNLLLAIDPLPRQRVDSERVNNLRLLCRGILRQTSELIVHHFPDRDPAVPYVCERFHDDWRPDSEWGWQLDRAIVGHNLKIAWNLTRVASFYKMAASQEAEQSQEHDQYAKRLMDLAIALGDRMVTAGMDTLRGGCYDAVERHPKNRLPIQFVWGNTKDFWQQEQAILAYLILHGATRGQSRDYLELARQAMAFWNHFFLDRDNRGIFFRTSANGEPIIQGLYAQKAAHSIAGYHSFELNYLAHIYLRLYVDRPSADPHSRNFCLFFCPSGDCGQTTLNVLPDFVRPNEVEITRITVNGTPVPNFNPTQFQIEVGEQARHATVCVEFRPTTQSPLAAWVQAPAVAQTASAP